MNEKENTRTVQEGYALFGKGDIPNLMKIYSDNVEWVIPGPADIIPFAGSYRGHQQVQQFFTKLADAIEFEQFEPREFIAQGDKVAVLGHSLSRVKATGQMIEEDWMHLFTLQEGKVNRFQSFTNTAAAVTAFSQQKARAM